VRIGEGRSWKDQTSRPPIDRLADSNEAAPWVRGEEQDRTTGCREREPPNAALLQGEATGAGEASGLDLRAC
jgi:hypothetical protein